MVFSSHNAEQGHAEHLSAEKLRMPSRRVFLRHARALLEEIDKAGVSAADTSAAIPRMNETMRGILRASAFMGACIESQAGSGHALGVMVITGSAGVGKSSLFNALAGEAMSPVSVIRPCTKQGVALVHPDDEAAFRAHPASRWVRIVCHAAAVRGVVLIDSPANDWAQPELYEKAQCLLDLASRIIFVTTAYRYGDGAAWDTLSRLHSRGVECAAVMNRVPVGADGTAEEDFRRLWRAAGLSSARIAVLYEGELCETGSATNISVHERLNSDGRVLASGTMLRDADRGMGGEAAIVYSQLEIRDHTHQSPEMSARRRRRIRHSHSGSAHVDSRQAAGLQFNVQDSASFLPRRSSRRSRAVHSTAHSATQSSLPAQSGLSGRSGLAEVRRWIDLAARGQYSRARTQRPHDPYADLRKDVSLVADSMDIARHALIDLCDRAREGAAAPFEKLMTNVKMGRFGQGSAHAVWQAAMTERGIFAEVKMPSSLGMRVRNSLACDAELSALLETIMASLNLALLQGLDTAMLNVERAWAAEILDTNTYVKRARAHIDKETIAQEALHKWAEDLADIARESAGSGASGRLWCDDVGLASLIGTAASGVNGAVEEARRSGLEESIWAARSALERRIRSAVEELVSCYVEEVRSRSLPDSSALRARLDEFLHIAYTQEAFSNPHSKSQAHTGLTQDRSNVTGLSVKKG